MLGYNFVDGNINLSDGNGYGIYVVGIVVVVINNSLGIVGMVLLVFILLVWVFDNVGNGILINIVNVIVYVVD